MAAFPAPELRLGPEPQLGPGPESERNLPPGPTRPPPVAWAVRPKGVHTKHLTELERFRVRTLYYDACMTKRRIQEVTGYSESQIRTAVRAKTFQIGKRTGRPRKGYRPTTAKDKELPSPSGQEWEEEDQDPGASAELIQQARNFFAHEESLVSVDDSVMDDQVTGKQPHSVIDPRIIEEQPLVRTGFNDLPEKIRLRIWQNVLSTLPGQTSVSRSWALEVKSVSPWIELGLMPPGVTFTNPPWGMYVNDRHVPAMALSHVNGEARQAVLERLTPIMVSSTLNNNPAANMPKMVWVDRVADHVHFFGQPTFTGMYDRAGRAAFPELYV
ncbi:Uu.00g142780.m01.CDS01 [Anthostomella pinea]|uniref:Uu.00g142780.m01.CDS01 n=1 Tax=Anthostomella pinea TaxID=933095 RepID=A0AAI8VRQ6_9PEZI|nr:Uu.00g142780.m01.CDS01 [Anthostomella pinea]